MQKGSVNGCVNLGDTDMYYVSFGSGDKKLVVLPGLSDGLSTVKGKAFLLKSQYKKYLKDYTVYIFSRKNKMPEGYGIRDMAADQAKAMTKLGIDKAYVLGVSQGGMIAQYLTIDHPELVERLILAVTAPYANDTAKEAVNGWIEMAKMGDHKALMVDTAHKTYSPGYLKKNEKLFPVLALFTKPKDYERFFRNAYAILLFDARPDLGKIDCPVYLLAGDDDKTVGNDAPGEFRQLVHISGEYIYNGYGHGIFDECKDFYDRVFKFCNDVAGIS